MDGVIVNCQTGEQTRRTFTPSEQAARLAEIAKAVLQEKARALTDAKQRLVTTSTELQTAQALSQAGDLKPEYVAEKQEAVAVARQRLKDLEAAEGQMEP